MNKIGVLITGVNGFIGRNLCAFLSKKKRFNILGIDNFFSTDRKCLKFLNFKDFFFLEKSILDRDVFKNIPFKIDVVIHLAAQTSVIRSIEEPEINNLINIDGFKNILNLSRENQIKKIIFASSSAVYGDDPNFPLKENSNKLNPLSYYASSKLKNEEMSKEVFKELKIYGLRLFNMYGNLLGLNTDTNYASVIPKWISNFKNNKKCTIFGDGESQRDFCYVNDLCEFLEILIDTNSKSGIYNFCTGVSYSIQSLHDIMKKIFMKSNKNFIFQKPEFSDFIEGEIKISYGDTTLLKEEFNYVPKTLLESGLKKIIK